MQVAGSHERCIRDNGGLPLTNDVKGLDFSKGLNKNLNILQNGNQNFFSNSYFTY